jgi:hypothetical protein
MGFLMSETAAVATRLELRAAAPAEADQRTSFTGVAVFDGQVWSALCRQLGIASDGDTPAEAVANLKAAVREALSVTTETGVSAGQLVDDLGLLEFMDTHQGPEAVVGFVFQV